jgi:hypothetical protein
MDPREYLEHLEDYQRDPWGSRAVVAMLAQVCAILCNVNRGKDTKPYSAEDFMPGKREAPAAGGPTTFADLLDTLKG